MSPPQLDILALEPYYGGPRRDMLDTLVRCSRHRWTVLKLPARRIERRLSVAAQWFAEQLQRHEVGKVDLLFTSEAMNLASLLQLVPRLADTPSVAYFHDNQLPDVGTNTDAPLDLVNLSTASAAMEIWFNSDWHRRTFLARAAALVERHPELAAHNPIPQLRRKASVIIPPVDLSEVSRTPRDGQQVERDGTAVFVEMRDAEIPLLSKALTFLKNRRESFRLITLGPSEALNLNGVPRQSVSEHDPAGYARGLREAGVILSANPDAACDFLIVRALAAGCRPVLPASGFYPELLPRSMQQSCLYEPAANFLADRLQEAISPFQTAIDSADLKRRLAAYDPSAACRQIDERFEELVWVKPVDD